MTMARRRSIVSNLPRLGLEVCIGALAVPDNGYRYGILRGIYRELRPGRERRRQTNAQEEWVIGHPPNKPFAAASPPLMTEKGKIMIELNNAFGKAVWYAACVGVDWWHKTSCIHLLGAGSKQIECLEVAAEPAFGRAQPPQAQSGQSARAGDQPAQEPS